MSKRMSVVYTMQCIYNERWCGDYYNVYVY